MEENNQNREKGLLEVDNVLDIKLSYSKLSSFDLDGPKSLIKRKELKGEGIDMGGLIDTILFTPKKLEKDYYIFDGSKPTASLGKLADAILENYVSVPTLKEVYNTIKAMGLWSSVKKQETLVAKFDNDEFWGYLKAMYESKNKHLVTTEQVQHAKEVVEVLQTHAYSKDIVAFPEQHESKYAQYAFQFRYRNVVLRGLMDLLVVNHKTKTIQAIDLKTGAPSAGEFSKSFIKYRYYFQEAIYQKALEHIKEELNIQDYTTLPFQFLYISRYEKIPLLYEVSDKWHNAAISGFTTTSGYRYKGIDEVIDDITWHWTNQKFDFSKEIYEQEGSLILNDDFIEVNE